MRLFGYIRVSTEDQAKDGQSLAIQDLQIQRYCDLYEHTLVDVFVEEGVSAGAPLENRPQGRELIARLQGDEAEGIVIQRLDRLTRVTIDGLLLFASFNRQGLAVHSVNDRIDSATPDGWVQLTLMLAMAEYERNKIRQRAKETADGLRAQGKVYGPTPYGCMSVDGRLFRDPTTWAVREQIMDWRKGLSLRAIVEELRVRKIAAPGGGRCWHVSTLLGIIRSHPDIQNIPFIEDVIDTPASPSDPFARRTRLQAVPA